MSYLIYQTLKFKTVEDRHDKKERGRSKLKCKNYLLESNIIKRNIILLAVAGTGINISLFNDKR